MRGAILAVLVTGCFSPTVPAGLSCEAGPNECPVGQACIGGTCRLGPVDGDVSGTDGGHGVWVTDDDDDVTGEPTAIWALDADRVFVATNMGLFRRSDGEWTVDETGPFTDIHGRGDEVWAVGANTRIYRLNGASWDPTATGITGGNVSCEAVHVVSADEVWLVGTVGAVPAIFRFDGSKWVTVPTPTPGRIHELWSVDRTLFGVGTNQGKGALFTLAAGEWRAIYSSATTAKSFLDVTGTDTTMYIAASDADHGELFTFDPLGDALEDDVEPAGEPELEGIFALDDDHVYAVGWGDELYARASDRTWSRFLPLVEEPGDPTTALRGAFAVPTRLWVVGDGPRIRYIDL